MAIINGDQNPSNLNDTLTGTPDPDTIRGLLGDDILVGLQANDLLIGGDGFDIFRGGGGNDTLQGGNDAGAVESGPAQGWQGGRADYSNAAVTGSIAASFGATATVSGNSTVGTDTLVNVQQVRGTNNADTFVVTAAYSNALFGPFAEFEGRGGNDTITGNAASGGNTRVSYQTAAAGVTVNLVAGTAQSIAAGDAAQIGVDSFTGVNQVRGSAHADILTAAGGQEDYRFIGGGGNDTIIGTMDGVNSRSSNFARYENATAGIAVVLGTGTIAQGVTSSVAGNASVGTDTLINVEGVRGTNFADTFTVTATFLGQFGKFNQIEGEGGNDTITGNGSTRVVFANSHAAVNVSLQNGTAQSLAGGDAAQVGVDSFTGVNQITGSDYNDLLTGSNAAQAERFGGGEGNDTINGGGGLLDFADYGRDPAGVTVDLLGTAVDGHGDTDTLTNIEGIRGSEFADILSGDNNANQLTGQGGNDVLNGRGGSDTLSGDDTLPLPGNPFGVSVFFDTGNDTLNGDAGNDTLQGGRGNDILNGGADIDTASFLQARSNYFVKTALVNGVLQTTVTHQSAAVIQEGLDTLRTVEQLQFAGSTAQLRGAQLNRTSNFDGERFDDVLLRNVDTGSLIFSDMEAGNSVGFGVAAGSLGSFAVVGKGDINGDAFADVFIQNPTNGQVLVARQAGTNSPTFAVVTSPLRTSDGSIDYKVAGVGDINGDATVDIVLQEQNSGAVSYGRIQNGIVAEYVNVTGPLKGGGLDYRVVGLGDVNRDGFSDVVLHEQTSGQVIYRDMAGGVPSGWGIIAHNIGDFDVKAVGDITGDGFADVIIQQPAGGDALFIDPAGGAVNNFKVVATGIEDLLVRGVADVDNDGTQDVLLQDASNGDAFYRHVGPSPGGEFWGVAAANIGTDYLVV